MPKKTPPVLKKHLVRCLGPGDEHLFFSEDACCHRICPRCAVKIEQRHLGRLFLLEPVHVPDATEIR